MSHGEWLKRRRALAASAPGRRLPPFLTPAKMKRLGTKGPVEMQALPEAALETAAVLYPNHGSGTSVSPEFGPVPNQQGPPPTLRDTWVPRETTAPSPTGHGQLLCHGGMSCKDGKMFSRAGQRTTNFAMRLYFFYLKGKKPTMSGDRKRRGKAFRSAVLWECVLQ